MKTTIDYTDFASEQAKQNAAVADIREYASEPQWQAICGLLDQAKAGQITFEQFAFALSIAGIEGYPVRAIWEMSGLEIPEQEA